MRMQLTGPQIRALRWHLENRNSPSTLGRFLQRFARVLVLWVACAALSAVVFVRIGLPEGAYVTAGAFLGAALREFRQHRWGVSVWPAIAAVVDWDRAERLVADAE